jgi:hypothetical protein
VSVTADNTEESTSWGDDDPSVFEMTKFYQLQGEFQVTNGYGTAATSVMRVCFLNLNHPQSKKNNSTVGMPTVSLHYKYSHMVGHMRIANLSIKLSVK